jgi:hypothetical protein
VSYLVLVRQEGHWWQIQEVSGILQAKGVQGLGGGRNR